MADNFTETPVKGKKSNNNAAPGNTNVGTLPAVATDSAPAYTEGNQVTLSTDLTGALRVAGGSSGTEYTEGAADATITGTAFLWEDTADTLRAVSAAKPLPVDIIDSTIAVTDNGGSLTVDGTVTVEDGGGSITVDGTFWQATQPVSGTVTANAGTGTFNVDLDSLAGTAISTGAGAVGAGTQRVHLSDESLSALETISVSGSVAVTGTFWQATQPVSGTVEIGSTSLAALESITIGTSLPAGTNNIGDVDVLTLPAVTQGTSAAVSAPWYVRLSDGAAAVGTSGNPLVVTYNESGTGTIADSGQLTTASVAAGGTTTFNSAEIAAGTGRLIEITASASVRLKVDFQTYNGTSATTKRTFFVDANQSLFYAPKDTDTLTLTGAAGATYRLVVTNMDNANAADVYASMTWTA